MIKNLFVFVGSLVKNCTIRFDASDASDESFVIQEIDDEGKTMVSVRLHTHGCASYSVDEHAAPVVVNLGFLNKAMVGVKKKDTVQIVATDTGDAMRMVVNVFHPDVGVIKSSTSISVTKGYVTSNEEVDYGACRGILVQGNEFLRLCKEIDRKSSVVQVTRVAASTSVSFVSSELGNMIRKEWVMGNRVLSVPAASASADRSEDEYMENYDPTQFTRMYKFPIMGNDIRVRVKRGLPLKISTKISSYCDVMVMLKCRGDAAIAKCLEM